MNLNQITVPSLDIEVSINFYVLLGLNPIVVAPHYARFECPNGESTFSVHLAEQLPGGAGITVYWECNDLDEQVAKLAAKGIIFDDLPEDKPWLWREAHLRDPHNNHLVLYYAGDNRKNPPWRIS